MFCESSEVQSDPPKSTIFYIGQIDFPSSPRTLSRPHFAKLIEAAGFLMKHAKIVEWLEKCVYISPGYHKSAFC